MPPVRPRGLTVAVAPGGEPRPRSVIFDLDETLLDTRRAWQYTLEEALSSVTGRRVDLARLAGEYRWRPWRDVLGVLVEAPTERQECEDLCRSMYERSALKRLLVHEGLAMGLDALRGNSVEMGAVSRVPHALALKQIESTGLDRFLSVLAPTPDGERWDAPARSRQCLRFFGYAAAGCAFVSGEGFDLRAVAREGLVCFEAGWAAGTPTAFPPVATPGELDATLMRAWGRKPG